MANYIENFASKLDWAMPFQRTGKFPLDRTDLFSSYADAVKYAAGNTEDPDSRGLCGTSYVGQVIVVYEDSKVSVYKIEENRTLKEVGTATLGDVKSIELGDGNVLSLKNFGKKYYKYDEAAEGHYVLVEDGTFPAGLQPKTTLAADGTIELAWYEPSSTTVEGLSEQMSSLSQTVNTMQQTITQHAQDIGNKVDKVTGKGLSTNDYTNDEKTKLGAIEAGAQKNVKPNWNAESGATSEILNKPTKLSDFTNDKNFIDKTVANLDNYYTKTEVGTMIGNIHSIQIQIPESGQLPETGSSNIIYLIPKAKADGENNSYDEYLWTGTKFEKIGDTTLDLSGYVKHTELADIAKSGSFNDLKDVPSIGGIKTKSVSISTDSTTITSDEGGIINIILKNSAGEQLIADITYTDAVTAVITLSETPTESLTALVWYAATAIGGSNT